MKTENFWAEKKRLETENDKIISLTTGRLLLRQWRSEDKAPFAALNADPEVMEHFSSPFSYIDFNTFEGTIEHFFPAVASAGEAVPSFPRLLLFA